MLTFHQALPTRASLSSQPEELKTGFGKKTIKNEHQDLQPLNSTLKVWSFCTESTQPYLFHIKYLGQDWGVGEGESIPSGRSIYPTLGYEFISYKLLVIDSRQI